MLYTRYGIHLRNNGIKTFTCKSFDFNSSDVDIDDGGDCGNTKSMRRKSFLSLKRLCLAVA